jgi:hypothetical protein
MTPSAHDDWGDATPYAPIEGPDPGTTCSFCGRPIGKSPERGWMIAPDAAICPDCVVRAARLQGDDRLGS